MLTLPAMQEPNLHKRIPSFSLSRVQKESHPQ